MKNLDLKLSALVVIVYLFLSFVYTNIDDFFLPGSQPLQSGTFNSPNQCDNCHGGYDQATEPAYNWRGSMMAHAMRDPLYLASLTIANQDAVDAGDLCIRCHSPGGWLEGRSVPTDGSALNNIDKEGVQCHFCHKLIDPQSTDSKDLAYMDNLTHVPTQHGNGMFVVDSEDIRRGPYHNVQSNHNTSYSAFHTQSTLCGTCHDVSNPAFSKQPDGSYLPNSLQTPTTNFDKYEMFPVERTFSEWKMSAYNTTEGVYSEVFGGNKANVISCQDCHMQDVTGKGANKNYAPIRYDLPLHDMTGGNTFVPLLVKLQNSPNIDNDAIDAGILRARSMLQNAATLLLDVIPSQNGYEATVEIINETGHKLPSGYPEGRRMWINLVAYDDQDNIIYESGAYDFDTAILNTDGTKIYEAKLGMTQTMADVANSNNNGHYNYSAGESFHFALNNTIIKDNRIPPRGFTNANFEMVQAAPVGYTYIDGSYSDKTTYSLPSHTHEVKAKLYYQTISKEYVEFLKEKNYTDNLGNDLYTLWANNGKSTPELMNEVEVYTNTLNDAEINNLENSITFYPNPVTEILKIKFNAPSYTPNAIKVFDFSGKQVYAVSNIIMDSNHVVFWNCSTVSKGSYIVNVQFKNYTVSRTIVVK